MKPQLTLAANRRNFRQWIHRARADRAGGADNQKRKIAAGEISSRELVDTYLSRIEHHDPLLNCYRIVFAERPPSCSAVM